MKTRWRVLRTRHHDDKVTTTIWMSQFAKEKDAQKEADQRNAMNIRTPKRPQVYLRTATLPAPPELEWNIADTYSVESWEAPE